MRDFVKGTLLTAAFLGSVIGFIGVLFALIVYAPPVVTAAGIFILLCILGGFIYATE
jgi:hypothetical protein